MANVTLTTRILLRNDTVANWISRNPILMKGEMGVEVDTGKFKFGDGVKDWISLEYASSRGAVINSGKPTLNDSGYDVGTLWVNTANNTTYTLYSNLPAAAVWKKNINVDDLADFGAGDMTRSVYATNPKSDDGFVDKAITADTLSTPRDISIDGDVIAASKAFDGSASVTLSAVLKSVVAAGTYAKVTVNEKGLVVGFESLTDTDIPTIPHTKISGLGTAATKSTGTASGNVVMVGADGKIDGAVIPSMAITEVFECSNESEMLGLTAAGPGDVAVRSDENKSYILRAVPASSPSNWVLLRTPSGSVLSVNGRTGAVNLTTADIEEGGNRLYYTEARATASFNTNIGTTSVSALADGGLVVKSSDILILNSGNAGGSEA